MDRRSFISSLSSFAALMALDPERLLWRAGEKKIFIPKIVTPSLFSMSVSTVDGLRIGDIITFGRDPKQWIITEEVISDSKGNYNYGIRPLFSLTS